MYTKLLIIPCSQSKKGGNSAIADNTIDEIISPESSELLRSARRSAFQRSQTRLDMDSDAIPALFRYSGNMWSVEGFREAIQGALSDGLHVLVESGGYGLIRVEEGIHEYEASINRTAPIWRHVFPLVLTDYISRNGINSIFVAGSGQYLQILRKKNWWGGRECRWFVARMSGDGNRYRVVPRAIGCAVRDLILSRFSTASSWLTN